MIVRTMEMYDMARAGAALAYLSAQVMQNWLP